MRACYRRRITSSGTAEIDDRLIEDEERMVVFF